MRYDQKLKLSSDMLKKEVFEAMKMTEASIRDRVCLVDEVILQLESLQKQVKQSFVLQQDSVQKAHQKIYALE